MCTIRIYGKQRDLAPSIHKSRWNTFATDSKEEVESDRAERAQIQLRNYIYFKMKEDFDTECPIFNAMFIKILHMDIVVNFLEGLGIRENNVRNE